MALDYDFYLTSGSTSLGFNFHITKDTPYERATAQFRKDQVDQGSTVGDQSLTGWWTRGQLSFHKGAGENYYEVSEGDSVLNRFYDSSNVEVFEPGQVTLRKTFNNLSLAAKDAVPAPLSKGGGVYALTTTVGVKYTAGSGSTAIATSDGVVPTAIATSGDLYYVCNGVKLERQSTGTETRTNHVTNPSFEVDASGWTMASGGFLSGLSTAWAANGSQSYFLQSGAGASTASRTVSGLTIGQQYVVSAIINVPTGGGTRYDVALSVDHTAVLATSAAGTGLMTLSGTFTATATSHVIWITSDSLAGGPGPNSTSFYLDSVLWTETPYVGSFFDGSSAGCSWVGTAGLSKSTKTVSTGTSSSVRITLGGGATWSNVWWAKGRIWAVDSDGYFYARADVGAAITNADAFWNSQRTGVSWSLADSPGAVFISDGNNIYSVTVDTDGLVPTINTPTTVAQIPAGETISSINYYLGFLIVTTTAGVRVAVVQDDQVFLGPLTIEGDFSASGRAGVWDTRVYVVGRPTIRSGSYAVCVIDLAQKIDDLVYAWSPYGVLTSNASTAHGALVDATGRLYSWAGNATSLADRDKLTSSGYVQTAYHRFGTLEGKSFASVLVRTAGGGGTLAVSRIDADGTETALSTITITSAGTTPIDLGMTGPAERIALKFTFTRASSDTSQGPTLLGYQIKALPAPERQRLMRLPFALYNSEMNHSGQKTAGSPVSRRQALEALEEANAVVTFTDNVTGETGTAFIEAVEVSQTQPAGRSEPGGLLYLTLRKIA